MQRRFQTLVRWMPLALVVFLSVGCETIRSNSSYTATRIQQFTDDPCYGTYLTGASDASQNTFHAFIHQDRVIWTPHLPADAAREFTNTLAAVLDAKELATGLTLNLDLKNQVEALANRTEQVEMLRYSLYTLSLMAINEELGPEQVAALYTQTIQAFSADQSEPKKQLPPDRS